MGKLLDNLPKMSRVEWNNLAKNRYCDEDIQVWLARHGHIQARYYLADNPQICDKAMVIMLAGKSAIVKAMMVGTGRVRDPDLIREIYKKVSRRSSSWRLTSFFVENYWNRYGRTYPATPPDVLEKILDYNLERIGGNHYYSRYSFEGIARHPNCSSRLAIRLSQIPNDIIKKAGFEALVRLESQKKQG